MNVPALNVYALSWPWANHIDTCFCRHTTHVCEVCINTQSHMDLNNSCVWIKCSNKTIAACDVFVMCTGTDPPAVTLIKTIQGHIRGTLAPASLTLPLSAM